MGRDGGRGGWGVRSVGARVAGVRKTGGARRRRARGESSGRERAHGSDRIRVWTVQTRTERLRTREANILER